MIGQIKQNKWQTNKYIIYVAGRLVRTLLQTTLLIDEN